MNTFIRSFGRGLAVGYVWGIPVSGVVGAVTGAHRNIKYDIRSVTFGDKVLGGMFGAIFGSIMGVAAGICMPALIVVVPMAMCIK